MEFTETVLPVHQRMAELYTINQLRTLTEEMFEMAMCLQVNAKYCWDLAYYRNIAIMEYMIYDDINYVDEISLDEDY